MKLADSSILEATLNKLDWRDKKGFTDDIIDLWEDYMDETSLPYNVYKMDDFDEAMDDLTPKEIMTFSNGNFDPDHKYYAFTEDCQAYVSFDKMADYECYVKEKENFALFLKKEGYIL